ncbi:MAG: sensor histidine kinase [Sciscionella sp.]
MTALGYSACIAAAVVVGVVIGVVATRTGSGRRRGQALRRMGGPTVAELIGETLNSLHNGILVLNEFGDVVLHNPSAVELGVVRDNRADDRARKAAEQVAATGEPVEFDLSPLSSKGRQPSAVRGEASRLVDEFVVVNVADESDSARLEATRRDFVANVSHELKTPVGALALLAEAVLGCVNEPEEVRRFSEKIRHEATRMGTLVTELIALSRLQGAEPLPDLNVVDVDAIVAEAHGRTTLAAESAGIEVTTDAASGLLLRGDRMLLVTALSNLVENALSYSAAGSPVSISRRPSGGFVEIAVTDRGIGIAPKHQQRVFERFYRVDKARSRVTGGTGLGLAIVKHVAANHGGEVALWSEPGVGSTFTMRIPAVQQATTTSGTAVPATEPDAVRAPQAASSDYEGVI